MATVVNKRKHADADASGSSCEICFEGFTEAGAKEPVILTACGHSYCRACVSSLEKRTTHHVKCPTCAVVTKSTAATLPKNFAVIKALQGNQPPKNKNDLSALTQQELVEMNKKIQRVMYEKHMLSYSTAMEKGLAKYKQAEVEVSVLNARIADANIALQTQKRAMNSMVEKMRSIDNAAQATYRTEVQRIRINNPYGPLPDYVKPPTLQNMIPHASGY